MTGILVALPSGLAGSSWLAALLRLPTASGARIDRRAVGGVPQRLGLDATIALRRVSHRRFVAWDVTVTGVDDARRATLAQMVERARASALPDEVVALSCALLRARHAAVHGDDEDRVLVGDEVDDTLVDVVAGVYAWWLHGRPTLHVWGPVVTGAGVGAGAAALVERLATRHGTSERELLTPTGAVLLGHLAAGTTMVPPSGWDVRVASRFARRDGLEPMLATRLGDGRVGERQRKMQTSPAHSAVIRPDSAGPSSRPL